MASAESASDTVRVEVAYSPAPRQVDLQCFVLPAGTTAAQAVIAAGLPARHPGFDLARVTVAVWGRAVPPSAVLRDGDRLELCRPLIVDPKEARRLRYRAQGERGRRRVSGSRSR
ncbi:RnfH family protein [Sphaerotilus sp.]|uniref:RnfH family protein n=1 Tax=Sphaerotilus sp. TaxID=2093942 RepID=UPI002ACE541D|nr:RnfH family protein [Sphaerotilus sp.]MDZ7855561.1 RnfH family protein [Sphaerotilus sp.]